ncbi:MAG TPA: thrombospondin type 3 repeat-containing protein [Phycisphaerae bacterium]|nr:thrombospondin type 3 repeat-containing protein [Phycisphaerae bacterium]HRY66474.1 thrombospondin type 3 repeat-containing protein [Phycisphaerae bacterium]HSA25818.1 thrombospondin type 3 repeat-containing protein [Phycisphaerae bacterium]
MLTNARVSTFLVLSSIATLCGPTGADADQRKFGVMLATAPKSAQPPLPNPDDVWNQYFNIVDPTVGSFAQYWNEISYGAVTVSGDVVGWIHLPWPILPTAANGSAVQHTYLGVGGALSMMGEPFSDGAPMYDVSDISGNPRVTNLTAPTEGPPADGWWTPGERFRDLNGDGRYSAYIEESYDGYDRADSATPPNCLGGDGAIGAGEFDDSNRNGVWDIPEPFEDFLRVYVYTSDASRRWVKCDPSPNNTDPASRQWAIDYITANYPGVDPTTGTSTAAIIIAHCGNGKYDGPERWSERGNTKMRFDDYRGSPTTPRPCDDPVTGDPSANPWKWDYDGWWQAYFTDLHAMTPNAVLPATLPPAPTWVQRIPNMVEFDPTAARGFEPNVGGTKARSGLNNFPLPTPSGNNCMGTVDPPSIGNGDMDGGYAVHTGTTIYPDATGYYDGQAEFSDLPSSIYHARSVSGIDYGGDGRLGEVTSPASTNPFGEDRGAGDPGAPAPNDGIIGPGGPGAYNLSGQNGYDGGNVLNLEYLTWFNAPVNDPAYIPTTPVEVLKRDYNLDGLLDQGSVRLAGTDNYAWDADPGNSNDGSPSEGYPFNRKRLTEDTVEALDASTDWNHVVSGAGTATPVFSGFTLLPGGLYPGGLAPGGRGLFQLPAPGMDLPIQTRIDKTAATNTADLAANMYSNTRVIAFSDFATSVDTIGETGSSDESGFAKGLMNHEFLHSWEGYPDLYDYDEYLTGPTIINTPIGGWCIMAGGPVHPAPILKEASGWIRSNDLMEILPPSIEWPVTLKDYSFDPVSSVYYFENTVYPGERFYFWRVTRHDYNPPYADRVNFNAAAPGEGVVILHADLGANPSGLPQQQRLGSHFVYNIVQADGQHQLETGENGGDDGDCYPGSQGVTVWNDTTNPSSRWYGQLPSGLSITNIVTEPTQSIVTFLWQPHIVPELRFLNPPGGVIMGAGANAYFPLKYEAWDAYGGTTIRLFFVDDVTKAANPYGGTELTDPASPLIKLPGVVQDGFHVPLSALPKDGTYYFYAELTPGTSPTGTERAATTPRAGWLNTGRGSIADLAVDTTQSKLETWIIECVDETAPGQEVWQVKGSVSGLQAGKATTGVDYITDDGGVAFRIDWAGITPTDAATVSVSNTDGVYRLDDPSPSSPFVASEFKTNDTVRILEGPKPGWYVVKSVLGPTSLELASDPGSGTGVSYRVHSFKANTMVTPPDRFTMVTTGKTPHSLPIRIVHGQIVPAVNAVIQVTFPNEPYNPLHQLPFAARFDATGSRDEFGLINNELVCAWDFGDGSPIEIGTVVYHTYTNYQAGGYTAILTVINPATGANATATTLITARPGDTDSDGVEDPADNCPTVANSDQADSNGNGIGDLCDPGIITDLAVDPKEALSTITVPEGATATFRVKLTMAPPPPSNTMQITVAPAAGPTTDPDITVSAGQTLTFTDLNWDTYQEVTLAAAADVDVCNGEAMILLTAPNPSKPTYLTTSEVLAAEEDDDAPSIVTNKTSLRLTEGSTTTMQVKLGFKPCADTVVSASLLVGGDPGITLSNPTELTFTAANWNTYQTTTVAAAKDADVCGGTATLRLSTPGAADKDVTVTADETTALTILADQTSVSVPEGGTATFRVKLGAQPCADTTVSLTLAAGNSHIHFASGSAQSLVFTTANWGVYQTVTLAADSDADAIIEQATITCSAPGTGSVAVTAVEAEKDIIYVLTDVTALNLQEGTTGTVQVRLSLAPQASVTVTASLNSTASPVLLISGQTLTFSPSNWNTYQPITVRAGWDTNFADDTVTLHLAAPGCEPKDVAVTQRDSDTQPQPDRDGDGVPDAKDNCAAIANANQANADGDAFGDACDICPQDAANDADQDGVCGDLDQCPATPTGEQVNAQGCACSQLDDDQDGVNNCLDECPNTVAGQTVDVKGCACSDGDADGDGVNDCDDQCANTPAGTLVDANGCPVSALTVSAGSDQTILTGHSATLTAAASGGLAPYSYAWTGPNLDSTNASVQVSPQAATLYTVTATDSVGQTATASVLVQVNSIAKVVISRSVDGTVTTMATEGYNLGLTTQIWAPSAPSGFVFDHWSGDLSGNENPATLLVDDDKSVVAHFVASGSPDSGKVVPVLSPFGCGSGALGATSCSLFAMLMFMGGRSRRRSRRRW